MRPSLSIVIPSVNGKQWLLPCLERVERQSIRESLEVIVCDRLRDDTADLARERFPWVRTESGLHGQSIPQLRWRGLRATSALIVALIEDHTMLPPTWAQEVLEAHQQYSGENEGVIGGPIENGSVATLFDWTFFLTEYAPLMPPLPVRKASGVAGGNVSIRRDLLPLDEERFAHLWENYLIEELRAKGIAVRIHPGMTILHSNPFTRGEFAGQRFLFLRSISAMRARTQSPFGRYLRALAAVAVLPWLLPARLVRDVWRKRRNRRELILGFPMIVKFLWAGVAGEVAGLLRADGGSLARVR